MCRYLAMLARDCAALNIAPFVQALAEQTQTICIQIKAKRRRGTRSPGSPTAARATSGHATAAPPKSVMNSRRSMSRWRASLLPRPLVSLAARLLARYRRDFKPELYPQKHGQEDQDRVQHDPHSVGSPTPSLLYSLLAHGEFSLALHAMVPPILSLPPNGWTGPWDKPELF
jgi:hypothetical protein